MARWQYQARAEPINPGPETPSLDKWVPSYPSALRRAPALAAAIIAGACFLCDILPRAEASPVDKWSPIYPVRLDPAKTILWAGWMVIDPLQLSLPETEKLDKWQPIYPNRLDCLSRILPIDHSTADYLGQVPSVEPITYDKWAPIYPNRLDPLRRAFWQGIQVIDPTILTSLEVPDLSKWLPIYPSRLDPPRRIFPIDHSTSDYLGQTPPIIIPTVITDYWTIHLDATPAQVALDAFSSTTHLDATPWQEAIHP